MSIGREVDKDVVRIHSGLLAIKKKKSPFAATRTNLEIVIWSEVRERSQKDKYMISLICGI